MGYNTRKKSFSLESLGIHVPVTHAERAAARLTPPSGPAENPPSKKIKRSHDESPAMSPPPKPIKYEENTPPPSPEAEVDEGDVKASREISLEGINDEIVEGVIVQLQKTANRPHLVKELAAILSAKVKIVEQ